MRNNYLRLISRTSVAFVILLSSCQSAPKGVKVEMVEGSMVSMDSTWDAVPDAKAVALLAPYKAKIDSMMYRIIGTAEVTMDKEVPEGLLSNLVADVLRQSATRVLGKPADMGLINLGGLRNILTEGPVTCGNIYEIAPFENSLCVVTLKGSVLKQLFEDIAQKMQGVSGVQLTLTKDGKLLESSIGGKPVDDSRLYTVATIDYLADGNDGVPALAHAEKRQCPEQVLLRDLLINYMEQQTAAGKKITSHREGRIVITN